MDRRATETVTGAAGTAQTVRHYADTSDNPVWVTRGNITQRYAELIGDDLALTVDQSANADLMIANPHGDIVTSVSLPTASQAATNIDGWENFDEYGEPGQLSGDTGVLTYGWVGSSQRAISGAGLTLMGARLYNPVSGLFTSVDPIEGGNSNAYTYPSDPVNRFDTTGLANAGERGGRGKPSYLTTAEWDAIKDKDAARDFDRKHYRSARRKIDREEKYAGDRNKQKRENNRRNKPKRKKGGNLKRVGRVVWVATIWGFRIARTPVYG